MALNSLLCADVPLRNCSLTQATKPSSLAIRKHSLGGCTIDMPPLNSHGQKHSFATRYLVQCLRAKLFVCYDSLLYKLFGDSYNFYLANYNRTLFSPSSMLADGLGLYILTSANFFLFLYVRLETNYLKLYWTNFNQIFIRWSV